MPAPGRIASTDWVSSPALDVAYSPRSLMIVCWRSPPGGGPDRLAMWVLNGRRTRNVSVAVVYVRVSGSGVVSATLFASSAVTSS